MSEKIQFLAPNHKPEQHSMMDREEYLLLEFDRKGSKDFFAIDHLRKDQAKGDMESGRKLVRDLILALSASYRG